MEKENPKNESAPAKKTPDEKQKKEKAPLRPELAELIKRLSFGLDENRPDAVEKRKKKNQRTARANIEAFCDPGSFVEYGALAVAAQRGRRSVDDLIAKTPADGLIAGVAAVNGAHFPEDKARCMIMAYDYTVLAGTQGYFNHKKMDRMLELAYEQKLPLVFFGEGEGGRPGDVDAMTVMVAGLDLGTFGSFARLSGRVPVVGIVSGPCFAKCRAAGLLRYHHLHEEFQYRHGRSVMIEGGGWGLQTRGSRPDGRAKPKTA